MKATVIIFGLPVVLFALAYASKRRFGRLGLGLCAGFVLSLTWSSSLTPFLEQRGITFVTPPLALIVAVTLTLLPAILLLFNGPTYHKPLERIVGSAIFAGLASSMILAQIGTALTFDSFGQNILSTLTAMSSLIISAGIIAALADLLLARPPKHGKNRGGH